MPDLDSVDSPRRRRSDANWWNRRPHPQTVSLVVIAAAILLLTVGVFGTQSRAAQAVDAGDRAASAACVLADVVAEQNNLLSRSISALVADPVDRAELIADLRVYLADPEHDVDVPDAIAELDCTSP